MNEQEEMNTEGKRIYVQRSVRILDFGNGRITDCEHISAMIPANGTHGSLEHPESREKFKTEEMSQTSLAVTDCL